MSSTSHSFLGPDLTAAIEAAADYPVQAVLAVHFWQAYEVGTVEALEAAGGIVAALEAKSIAVLEGPDLDRLYEIERIARSILKLRKNGIPQRDTQWKIAWRDLEEATR